MLYAAAHVMGFLLLILGVVSFVSLFREKNRPFYDGRLLVVTVLLGIALGVAADAAAYMLDPRTKAFGFPLIFVIFQQDEQGRWLDYVGWSTPTFFVGNFLIGLGLPHLVLAVYVGAKRRAASLK